MNASHTEPPSPPRSTQPPRRVLARQGFAFRLACVTSALVVSACAALSWVLVQQAFDEFQRSLNERGRTISDYAAREAELSVISGNVGALAQLAENIATQGDVAYCAFFDADGTALHALGERRLPAAAAGADHLAVRDTDTGVREFLAPIVTTAERPQREELEFVESGPRGSAAVGQTRIGTVAIGISLAPLEKRRSVALATAASLTLGVALAGVVCAFLFARAATRPLQALTAAADAIARGDLGARVAVATRDEFTTLAASFNVMGGSLAESRAALEQYGADLEVRSASLEAMNRELVAASEQVRSTNAQLVEEIAERERAQEKLIELHKQLLTVSRQAGMAEVATGVLHNIGNALNSVNVSATVIDTDLQRTRLGGLKKGLALLRQHAHDLSAFLASDPKGRQLLGYLEALSEHLEGERAALRTETAHLQESIGHIRRIVAAQQSHAAFGGALEPVDLASITDDALRLSAASLSQRGIEVARTVEPLPIVVTDRHRVLGILMNLLGNAAHALDERPAGGRLVVRIGRSPENRVMIEISDNGVGIAPENLSRIFSFGFTTRPDGHGFGLHSSANAAVELGGRLAVRSDGPGLGATFTLELPAALDEHRPGSAPPEPAASLPPPPRHEPGGERGSAGAD